MAKGRTTAEYVSRLSLQATRAALRLEPSPALDRRTRDRAKLEARNIFMSVILQSTVGGFSAEFLRKLPLVERAMREHGLEPSAFVISKDSANTATIPLVGPFFYDYTVFFGEEKFTVTEPNDMLFLDYFFKRVLAADEAPKLPRPPGLIRRLFRWMTQPI